MEKRSICWNITSRCNENCKFCYRIIADNEISLEKNMEILKVLIELSVDKISWTGGEALLYPNLIELLKVAKKNGIKNNLITNGRELSKENICEIASYIDYLTLSYDSNSDDIHGLMGRGINHGKHIIEILDFINDEKINIRIKINTLVSKMNKSGILDIANVLKKYQIERWKLFKFIPLRNYAIENKFNFEISDKEFNSIILNLKEIYSKSIKIVDCDEKNIQKNYLLINSLGDFIITEGLKDKKIYNINENNIDILKKYL